MRPIRVVALGAFALAASISAAGAQSNPAGRNNPCDFMEASFPLTDANRLDDRRLAQRFDGKTFVVQRRLIQNLPPPRKRSFERVMSFFFRSDQSLRMTCQHRKSPGTALLPCEGFGPSASPSASNATDIAVWRIHGGRICWQRTKNESEMCFFVHEADGRGYVRLDGGRRVSCFEGAISFQ